MPRAAPYAPAGLPNPTPPTARDPRDQRRGEACSRRRSTPAGSGSSPRTSAPATCRSRRPPPTCSWTPPSVRDPPRRLSGQRADQARGAARARDDQRERRRPDRAPRTDTRAEGDRGRRPGRARTCRWRCRSRAASSAPAASPGRASTLPDRGPGAAGHPGARGVHGGASRSPRRRPSAARRSRASSAPRRRRRLGVARRQGPGPAADARADPGRRRQRGHPRRGRARDLPRDGRADVVRPDAADPPAARAAADPRARTPGRVGDDWPHTTRLLPVDVRRLPGGGLAGAVRRHPAELPAPDRPRFDRLVLPFVVATWVVAAPGRRAAAPRMQLTRIHPGVGAFVTVAFISVILDARELNRHSSSRARSSSCRC